jgi:acetyl esterase
VADGGPVPAFQALIYPVTDYSKVRQSRSLFGDGFFLTARQMDWYREHYLSAPEQRLDPRASPLLGELAGLPPTYVVTAGFDPLRDEGEAYAHALETAGVEVTLRRETDLVHGFVNAVGLGGRAREATSAIADAIRAGLARPGP